MLRKKKKIYEGSQLKANKRQAFRVGTLVTGGLVHEGSVQDIQKVFQLLQAFTMENDRDRESITGSK